MASIVAQRSRRLALMIIPLSLLIGIASLGLDHLQLAASHLLLVLALLLVTLLPFAAAFFNRNIDLFHPVFVFAWTLFVTFVVATFVLVWRDYRLISGIDYRAELGKTLVAALVAILASYLGYFIARKALADLSIDVLGGTDKGERRARRVQFSIAMLVLILTVSFFVLWLYFARIPLDYLNALDADYGYTTAMQQAETSIVYLWMFRLSWPLLILFAWTRAPNTPSRLVVAALWLANFAVYFISANRGSLFFFAAATIVFYYLRKGRRPSFFLAFSALALLSVAAGYLVIARGSQPNLSGTAIADEVARELTVRGPLTGVMDVQFVFPEKLPYIGFEAISDVVYAPIPRVLWPDKPYLRPVENIMTGLLPRQDAHAPSVIGIYYAGFGFVGVFAILFIYGFISRAIYNMWHGNPDSPLAQLLLAGWYSYIWNLIIRGALSQTVISITYIFGPLIAAWFVAQLIARPAPRRTRAAYE